MNSISEKTKIALGSGIAVAIGACSVWASVSASLARTDVVLSEHTVKFQNGREEQARMEEQISLINARTARMEGILEEMRERRK